MKKITVLGNNSGRNAGDNAILGNLLDDFAAVREDIEFIIPTINTSFITREFGHHTVNPIGQMPWNLSAKNFGLPLYRAMTSADLILVTDNILFDKSFFNPLFNYLSSIALVAPFCHKKGIPIVLYNASVGPITTSFGKKALQKVLDASPLVICRDIATRNLIESRLRVSHPPIVVHADCALNTEVPSQQRMDGIIRKEGLFANPTGTVGMNVNAYIDSFNTTSKLNRKDFCQIIASSMDRIIETLGVDILMTISQTMDKGITEECRDLCKYKGQIRIVANTDYSYKELTGLLHQLEIHAGLRTHTLIFCAAANTPMVNINAYPKSHAFMGTIGMSEWSIPVTELTVDDLTRLVFRQWEQRHELRKRMKPVVEEEKYKARASVALIDKLLG